MNNITPEYTRHPIPHFQQSTHSLREQIRARKERFKNSFYPKCLNEWEKLLPEVRQAPSLSIFKSKILALIRPPSKPEYGIHDPKGLAILTQLKVGLSKLNFHKFRHNFSDAIDPMCPANDGGEDTEHYLLFRQSYKEPRRELLDGFNEISPPSVIPDLSNELSVEFILYGNERLPLDVNKRLIEATLKFIHASRGKFCNNRNLSLFTFCIIANQRVPF